MRAATATATLSPEIIHFVRLMLDQGSRREKVAKEVSAGLAPGAREGREWIIAPFANSTMACDNAAARVSPVVSASSR